MRAFLPLVHGNHPFADEFRRLCEERQDEHDAWVARLRAEGVAAAHPDDGWVDRDVPRVRLVYPAFDDGVKVGSLVALGDSRSHRLVRLVRRYDNPFGGKPLWDFVLADAPFTASGVRDDK